MLEIKAIGHPRPAKVGLLKRRDGAATSPSYFFGVATLTVRL